MYHPPSKVMSPLHGLLSSTEWGGKLRARLEKKMWLPIDVYVGDDLFDSQPRTNELHYPMRTEEDTATFPAKVWLMIGTHLKHGVHVDQDEHRTNALYHVNSSLICINKATYKQHVPSHFETILLATEENLFRFARSIKAASQALPEHRKIFPNPFSSYVKEVVVGSASSVRPGWAEPSSLWGESRSPRRSIVTEEMITLPSGFEKVGSALNRNDQGKTEGKGKESDSDGGLVDLSNADTGLSIIVRKSALFPSIHPCSHDETDEDLPLQYKLVRITALLNSLHTHGASICLDVSSEPWLMRSDPREIKAIAAHVVSSTSPVLLHRLTNRENVCLHGGLSLQVLREIISLRGESTSRVFNGTLRSFLNMGELVIPSLFTYGNQPSTFMYEDQTDNALIDYICRTCEAKRPNHGNRRAATADYR